MLGEPLALGAGGARARQCDGAQRRRGGSSRRPGRALPHARRQRRRSSRPSRGGSTSIRRSVRARPVGDRVHDGRCPARSRTAPRVRRSDPQRGGALPALARALRTSDQGRYALFHGLLLALAHGDLDECQEVLATLRPFVGRVSMLRPHMILAEAICRYYAGGLRRARSTVSRRRGACPPSWQREPRVRGQHVAPEDQPGPRRLRKRRGPQTNQTGPRGLNERLLELYRLQARLRQGQTIGDRLIEAARSSAYSRVKIVGLLVDAEAHVAKQESGDIVVSSRRRRFNSRTGWSWGSPSSRASSFGARSSPRSRAGRSSALPPSSCDSRPMRYRRSASRPLRRSSRRS